MRVQIMGAGALGSLVGALIQLAGYEVVFVARGKQLEALRKRLIVSGLKSFELEVYATDKPEDADVTFVTVKAYDTEEAAKVLSSVDAGVVCSLQNGIGNEEVLAKFFENVVGGVTSYAANLADYGHVVFAGEGFTFVGDYKGRGAEDVAKVLNEAGIRTEVVEDIERRIWVKAAINAAINPITALCRVRNGAVASPPLWHVAKMVGEECKEVLAALGYEFDVEEIRQVAEATAENRSSMLQDVEKGKRTEVDYINGAFVKKGEELGIDCVANRILWLLVRGVGSG
ncbi:MAG: 2-dehydropantoate 2-reductase [Archaeoglobaceae archaeon]